jgi:hypothetical protein
MQHLMRATRCERRSEMPFDRNLSVDKRPRYQYYLGKWRD